MRLLYGKLVRLLAIGALISIGEIAFNTVVASLIALYVIKAMRYLSQNSDPC